VDERIDAEAVVRFKTIKREKREEEELGSGE
jgi:hypothetical protein